MRSEPSMLAEFHNQKKPDFSPETHVVYAAGEKGLLKYHELEEIELNNKTIGETSTIEQQLVDVIKQIDGLVLEESYSNDVEQQKLLTKKKSYAKDRIFEILKNINYYHSAIMALDNVKLQKETLDQEDYIKKLVDADTFRKQQHNVLLSNIQSTIRFIAHNFGKINEEAIEKWEEEQEDRGLPIVHAKRIEFPENVLCPSTVNTQDRKQVARWANQLWNSLSELEKRLSA